MSTSTVQQIKTHRIVSRRFEIRRQEVLLDDSPKMKATHRLCNTDDRKTRSQPIQHKRQGKEAFINGILKVSAHRVRFGARSLQRQKRSLFFWQAAISSCCPQEPTRTCRRQHLQFPLTTVSTTTPTTLSYSLGQNGSFAKTQCCY